MEGSSNKSVNVDLKEYTSNFSFDIISEVAFGYYSNSQKTSNQFVTAMKEQVDVLMSAKRRVLMNLIPSLFIKEQTNLASDFLNEVYYK